MSAESGPSEWGLAITTLPGNQNAPGAKGSAQLAKEVRRAGMLYREFSPSIAPLAQARELSTRFSKFRFCRPKKLTAALTRLARLFPKRAIGENQVGLSPTIPTTIHWPLHWLRRSGSREGRGNEREANPV
jgi:hypothetical protein